MNRIPISVEGYKRLEKELDELKKERPAVIQAIKEAREEGDLRENAGLRRRPRASGHAGGPDQPHRIAHDPF